MQAKPQRPRALTKAARVEAPFAACVNVRNGKREEREGAFTPLRKAEENAATFEHQRHELDMQFTAFALAAIKRAWQNAMLPV